MMSKLYEWEEKKLNLKDSNFEGNKDNVVVTSGSLVLDPKKTTWTDFSPTKKWSDL